MQPWKLYVCYMKSLHDSEFCYFMYSVFPVVLRARRNEKEMKVKPATSLKIDFTICKQQKNKTVQNRKKY